MTYVLNKRVNMKAFAALILSVLLAFFAQSVRASNIVQISVDATGIPFLLDEEGFVWAFRDPIGLQNLTKLPKLKQIKKIAPYIALDTNGQVFTWSLNESEVIREMDSLVEAAYSVPQRVEGLSGVTQVASSIADLGNHHYLAVHFVAVIGNRDIVDWSARHDEITGMVSVSPLRKVFSRDGVRRVASASWAGVIQPASSSTPRVVDTTSSLIALFSDGSVIGWGISPEGRMITPQWGQSTTPHKWEEMKSASWSNILLAKVPGAIDVAIDQGHIIVLSENGVPKYWGGCSFGTPEYSMSLVSVNGMDGYVDNAIAITLTSINALHSYDAMLPDTFIRRDGSLWAVYAPNVQNMPKTCIGATETDQKAWQLILGHAPVIQVASGGRKILALDANYELWNVIGIHREFANSNSKIVASKSHKVQVLMGESNDK